MKHLASLTLVLVALAGCQTTTGDTATQNTAPDWFVIVGKPLMNGDVVVTLNRNGTLVGTGIEGVWEERDGKYCRTLTKPERLAGTECQVVTLDGNSVTFDNETGRTSTWTF